MRVLFPADYFSPKKPDEIFLDQAAAFKSIEWEISTINFEELTPSSTITPVPEKGGSVLYRGWMLSAEEYGCYISSIENVGAQPFTSLTEYLLTHHLPNWYGIINDLTPETVIFSLDQNLEQELINLGWEKFFIKDYVKSLKTSVGSIIDSPSKITAVVREMEKFRGTIEGGICVRKVESFLPETEKRYFVIDGIAYASNPKDTIPDCVYECAHRIKSRFFSVDAVQTVSHHERVVEIGDGQVSDILGWDAARFAEIWAKWCEKKEGNR